MTTPSLRPVLVALGLLACGLTAAGPARGEEPATGSSSAAPTAARGWADVPLPLSVHRGIKWLVLNQNEDGGWGQEGSRSGSTGSAYAGGQQSDLGNTSLAALAILTSGSRPDRGTFQGPLHRAVEFILAAEGVAAPRAAHEGRRGRAGTTQLQGKIGRYADTYLAARVLLEADGHMRSRAGNTRVHRTLTRLLDDIAARQSADGSWNHGTSWAPIHSTAFASQALAEAKARGFEVDEAVLARAERFTVRQLRDQARQAAPATPPRRGRSGRPPVVTPSGGPEGADVGPVTIGGAGVVLYSLSQGFEQLSRTPALRTRHARALRQIQDKVSEPRVMQGFGSMGGEEFISYANLAVGMARLGTPKAGTWIDGLAARMEKLQNRDGSWSGHHCITGRTAVTGLAVLTLTAERQAPRRAR